MIDLLHYGHVRLHRHTGTIEIDLDDPVHEARVRQAAEAQAYTVLMVYTSTDGTRVMLLVPNER